MGDDALSWPRVPPSSTPSRLAPIALGRSHVRPRQIRCHRLCGKQSVLPRGTRTARRHRFGGGRAHVRRRAWLQDSIDSLCLFQTDDKPAHLHLAFTAEIARRSKPSTARRCFRRQGQWCPRPAPSIPRELLCSFRHRPGRPQHRSASATSPRRRPRSCDASRDSKGHRPCKRYPTFRLRRT